MTDVEINSTLALGIETAQVAHDGQRQFPAKAGGRAIEQLEQLTRGFAIEDSPKVPVLNHGLRAGAEMAKVGEANPVDPGRVSALPTAPHQPRHIQQVWGVVSH